MYLAHWGLSRPPFQEDGWFYEGPDQEEALARLLFLVDHAHRLGLLAGETGSGKSLLLDVLAAQLVAAGTTVARVNLHGVGPREFGWKLASQLELTSQASEPLFRLWWRIRDRLREERLRGGRTVLLIDDADLSTGETLDTLSRLVAVDLPKESRVTFIVASSLSGLEHLPSRILEEAKLLVQLEPLTLRDLKAYLDARLSRCGSGGYLFTNAALEQLLEMTGGLPRRVNHMAELSLAVAAAQQMACVDAVTVDGAFEELGTLQLPRRSA